MDGLKLLRKEEEIEGWTMGLKLKKNVDEFGEINDQLDS